jgi:hypothetical protein
VHVGQQRWVLAIGSTVISAAVACLVLWLLGYFSRGGAGESGAGFAPSETLGFLLEPGTVTRHATADFDVQVTTNSLGLRGPEVVVPRPSGTYRILALGDSFSFGWGVAFEDAWDIRMARELQATDGRSVEVVIAGVPGWSLPQEFIFLEQHGFELEPDLVLWQLCSNDLLEMQRLDVEIDARRLPIAVAAEPPLSNGLRGDWLVRFEQLDESERQRILDAYRAGHVDPVLREIIRSVDAARREQAGPSPEGDIAALPIEDVLRGLRSGPDFGVRYVEHMVSAARASCAEHGIALRIMLAQARSKPGAVGRPEDGLVALRAWLSQQSPRVLDTIDLLPFDGGFYFSRDPHWTPAAQPLVARAAADWLADDAELGLSLIPGR